MARDWSTLRALPGSLLARAQSELARLLPVDLPPEQQYRARVLVALVAIFNVILLATTPIDAAIGAWGAVALEIGSLVVVDALLASALARGKIAAMGHFVSALLVVNLTIMAQEKGGLLATEIAWQCTAILFATLVVGPRGALLWTGAATASLGLHVWLFDPSGWQGRPASIEHKFDYGIDIALLYLATWGLAYAFDRARATFLGRLERRSAEMRLVLDHAGDALLTIDRLGRLGEERSARADALLGKPPAGALLWDVLGGEPENAPRMDLLRMSWDAIVDGALPRELALEQAPKRVTFDRRSFDLRLTPIDEGPTLRGALVVLHDVTDEIARESAERARRELLAVFEHVRTDPTLVADFLREMDRLVDSAAQGGADGAVVLRDIHTIKGNAGLFGIESLAALCHDIEERCHRAELSLPLPADRALLASRWAELSSELREWSGALGGDRVVPIALTELAALRSAIATGAPPAKLGALLAEWELTPASRVLSRLRRQGQTLAARLEKAVDFRVEVDPPALRIDTNALAPVLSSLVHAVRNALDHGVSDPQTRTALGKPARAAIVLRAKRAEGLVLEVTDDGEGIAWDAVRRKAEALGIPAATSEDLMRALLSDGFSTRDEATSLSGRGVGLAGIRQATEALGGTMTISSEPARGSRLEVRLPLERSRATSPSVLAAQA